jgi:hypothetical protein
VSDPSPLLDRAGIEEAFRRLGERLAKRGVVADLYVFGGAAMALAYDSRRATRDVDALLGKATADMSGTATDRSSGECA